MPRRGDIAVCSHGYLGLILKDESIPQTSPTGVVEADLWTGIHLTTKGGKQVGGLWQSRRPKVLCHIGTVLAASGDSIPGLVPYLRAAEIYGVEVNPPEPGNLFPPQPYESVRHHDIYRPRPDHDPAPQIRHSGNYDCPTQG